jgi:preprotein translocase subunit YajC
MIDAVYAQAASGGMGALNSLLVPTVMIIGIMYFLMIRPQQKRMKDHQAMLDALRRGDQVVTGGGVIGKIIRADEEELQVEIAEGVRVRVLRSTITDVRGKTEPAGRGESSSPKSSGKSGGSKPAATSDAESS